MKTYLQELAQIYIESCGLQHCDKIDHGDVEEPEEDQEDASGGYTVEVFDGINNDPIESVVVSSRQQAGQVLVNMLIKNRNTYGKITVNAEASGRYERSKQALRGTDLEGEVDPL